jgi:tetratricopeptide (TPR) repeat protein
MHFRSRVLLLLSVVVIGTSCSTKKNTFLTRTYHQTTARYNAYFNGRESYRSGLRRIERNYRFDYNQILPVFLYDDPTLARSVTSEMDRAIDKSSKVISRKSITARPKGNGGFLASRDGDFLEQKEYNRWVRKSYLLAGKSHFHKHDFVPAIQAFLFIIREYSMNQVRHEAKIWLTRSHIHRERYHEAGILIGEMLKDPEFPENLHGELYSTIADFHLKQDQLAQATASLEKAIEFVGNNDRRIRYTYILAQLYERTGRMAEASEYYSRVIRMNPPYEMAFNASINLAGVVRSGGNETARMINILERMLRDEKNMDYLDQVYFALGNIYLRNKDEENAMKYFRMSASAPGMNPSQKSMAYLALGEIYFNRADYLNAQPYYDSAVINMPPLFPDQLAITERSSVLNELAGNIRLFQLEDSLQLLAALSETDLNRKIDEIMAWERENQAKARQLEMLARQTNQFRSSRVNPTARRMAETAGEGNWYFYNQQAVNFGKNEFESIWGARRLEDNWRRSNRQVISTIEPQLAAMPGNNGRQAQLNGEQQEEPVEAGSRESYLMNIPLTEEAMAASHQRLQEALFSMGSIYKDDLRDYGRSAEAYRELVRRYPDGDLRLPALYDLHEVFKLDMNDREAEYYKNLIVSTYPGSPYAAILTNPNFFIEHELRLREAERYYETTFELFRERKPELVRERADHARRMWPDSPLIPHFEYLRALSWGSSGNIPLFKDLLGDYISLYPGTPMAEDARLFLAYLDEDYPELIQLAELPEVQNIYEANQKGVHNFVLIVDNRQDLINRMIFNIVNFNVDHFARLDLQVGSEQFSANYHLIRVNGLPDVKQAIDYLRRFNSSEEVFRDVGRNNYSAFIISPDNYSLFMKDRNIAAYLKYFEAEYLERR